MTYLPQKFVGLAAITALGASLSFAAAPKTASGPASKSSKSAHHSTKKSHKARPRGQQAIDSERCREIQQALVREHYMIGQPSGTWDDTTQQAMRRYQADQGWQNKAVPDSRALIRLGLGPNHEHLLNPETAMTTPPQLPRASQNANRSASASSRSASVAGSSASSSPATSMPGQSSPTATPVSSVTGLSPQR
jgi:peptidoglycan hydrolase-like protein with peptidoglycan-binding domain